MAATRSGVEDPRDDSAGDDPLVLEDGPLTHMLFLVARVYRQAIGTRIRNEQWLVDAGFRPPCVGALMTLAHRQPLSQRELSTLMGVDPSDLVGVMDILDEGGFVSRQRDPADRRRHLLRLTPDGRKAARRLQALLAEVDDEVLSPLPSADRDVLRGLLAEVVGHHLRATTTR